jgi:hypothetical protein
MHPLAKGFLVWKLQNENEFAKREYQNAKTTGLHDTSWCPD